MENEQNILPDAASPNAAPPASADAAPSLDVILASASPRRRQLLADAGVTFTVRASEVDEALDADLLADPREAAKKLAERKAGAVVQEVLAELFFGGVPSMVVTLRAIAAQCRKTLLAFFCLVTGVVHGIRLEVGVQAQHGA